MPSCTSSDIHVVALKRSAHHAFIDWLCEWKGQPALFINNVIPLKTPSFGSVVLYEGGGIGVAEQKAPSSNAYSVISQSPYEIVLNFEGRSIQRIEEFSSTLLRCWGRAAGKRVLFLRDPLNNFASLVRRVPRNNIKQVMKCLSQIFRFCDYMEKVRNDASSPQPFFDEVVLFSPWQVNEEYRQQVAKTFGLRDSSLKGRMSSFGGGSSFSGLNFDPAADHDKLFSRWRVMENNDFFLSLFLDDRIYEAISDYYERFGEHEPLESAAVIRLREKAKNSTAASRAYQIWVDGFEHYQAGLDRADCKAISTIRHLSRFYVRATFAVSGLFSVAKRLAMPEKMS